MKELSIEEKARRYDEALKEAVVAHKDEDRHLKATLERIFPELQESEEERIRKDIIFLVKDWWDRVNKDNISTKEQMIAWLEKQGEQKSADTDNKFIRMRETKPKDISEFLDRLTTVEQEFLWEHIAKIRELDKEEQKPVDKVEPKFHEGDWISGYYTNYKVLSVNNEGYVVEDADGNKINILFENEKFHHLWTIQDAKDGDILISFCNQPFIYNGKFTEKVVGGYCGLDVDGNFIFIEKSTKECNWTCNEDIKPATKEQRGLLFKKMREAGYEWNAEKKELKKIESRQEELTKFEKAVKQVMEEAIECGDTHNLKADADMLLRLAQKPAWSEEDEEHIKSLLERLEGMCKKGATFIRTRFAISEDEDWLKSLKERVTPQLKQEWSEEDENRVNRLIAYFEDKESFTAEDDIVYANWLKSLRPQKRWKPSDEQIGVIEAVINNRSFQRRHLDSLYEQLKKLREE